jgi:hypothetical protein
VPDPDTGPKLHGIGMRHAPAYDTWACPGKNRAFRKFVKFLLGAALAAGLPPTYIRSEPVGACFPAFVSHIATTGRRGGLSPDPFRPFA